MPEQVPFINREHELALIDELIKDWGTLKILCINAPGGIGKTRLLQEIPLRYPRNERKRIIITDIIDFDDRTFHTPENVGRKIAQMLEDEMELSEKDLIKPYMQHVIDYRKMEMAGVSAERLQQQYLYGNSIFIECFNNISKEKRIVLSIDTTDALQGTDFWSYLVRMAGQLKNVVFLLAGRNAREINEILLTTLSQDNVQTIDLPELEEKAGEEYLQRKQELLHVEFDPDLRPKLLLLSEGKPILIDLAAEWLARNIPFEWLARMSLDELQSLDKENFRKRQQEFERQLVLHIAQEQLDSDTLILWMSRIYPLDISMIATFLELPEEKATKLAQELQTYAFVKHLPDGRLTLHDEMRRMILEYVWKEVDPEGGRQRRDSRIISDYLEQNVQDIDEQIAKLEKEEQNAVENEDVELELRTFAKREALERETWILKAEYLKHSLMADVNEGVKVFTHLFDEAAKTYQISLRETLLVEMQRYVKNLSGTQLYELNSRRIQYLQDRGEYSEAKRVVSDILEKVGLLPEQHINRLIALANIDIRLGDVKTGIANFEEAVEMSEKHNLSIWRINSLNGLGWAYRLIGDLENAQKCYLEARMLCLKEGINKKSIQEHYGWLLNNLAFVLSNDKKNSQTAIDIARTAIEHWQSIGNEIGLGASYSMLGIAYYRTDISTNSSEEAFQKALNIFEPLHHHDLLGQIYSWRGALYLHIQEFDKAEKDLKNALETGSQNIKAMTLNRLGRVYMARGNWEQAEKYVKEALQHAQKIPDYMYWLGSLGRLVIIAAEKGQTNRLDEFEQTLKDFLDLVKKPDKSSLGQMYIGLAKLGFGQNDTAKVDKIIAFLKQGIPLIVEYGPYSRTDVLKRLAMVEKDFNKINPQLIRTVGISLQDYFSQKEAESIAYSPLTNLMYKWANWRQKESTNE